MADNIYILEGGYFWKQLPSITMPAQTDLFGQPLGDSKRTCTQHHGLFQGKRTDGQKYQVLLALIGRVIVYDDVLRTEELTPLRSDLLLEVPKAIYDYPFEPGQPYIINSQGLVTRL